MMGIAAPSRRAEPSKIGITGTRCVVSKLCSLRLMEVWVDDASWTTSGIVGEDGTCKEDVRAKTNGIKTALMLKRNRRRKTCTEGEESGGERRRNVK